MKLQQYVNSGKEGNAHDLGSFNGRSIVCAERLIILLC